jgi:zinc protease
MTSVNRAILPEIRLPKKLLLPDYETITFANGMKVFVINNDIHDLCKAEWVFDAGRWFESQKGVARFTNRQLREGSSKFNSKEISEKIDFMGATLRTVSTVDHATVSIMSLNKHFQNALELTEDVIKRPAFSESELEIVVRNNKEKLRVELQKNEFIADQKMNMLLYGKNHPYGYEDEEKNFDAVTAESLKNFHRQFYTASNGFMLVSGKVTDDILKQLEKYFGSDDWKGTKTVKDPEPFEPAEEKKITERKKDAFQSAIRFCKTTIGKTHPDYHKLSILNTIFGGYFGSRLMTNIREDKGYTYGIYSGITNSVRAAYFHVSTEVGVEVSDAAVKEIIFEIERLKNELVSQEELSLVQNYLTGKLLGNFDSPFNVAAMYKNLFIYGLDVQYLHTLMDTIHSVTAEDLRDMANLYFDLDEMYKIVIG